MLKREQIKLLFCIILTEHTGGCAGGFVMCLMSNGPRFSFSLASEPVGKPQGWCVLLLAPKAQINYLFTLKQLEAARGERPSVKKRDPGESLEGEKRHGGVQKTGRPGCLLKQHDNMFTSGASVEGRR